MYVFLFFYLHSLGGKNNHKFFKYFKVETLDGNKQSRIQGRR